MTFSGSVRSRLRHLHLILRILCIWRIKSIGRLFEDPAHLARMKSLLRRLQCFESLPVKSIFLCQCPDYHGVVCKYRTQIDVCVHQTPVFRRIFNASIMQGHAWCVGREKSAPRVSTEQVAHRSRFQIFSFTSRCGPMDSWILLLKYCYNLEKASREISKKWGFNGSSWFNAISNCNAPNQ